MGKLCDVQVVKIDKIWENILVEMPGSTAYESGLIYGDEIAVVDGNLTSTGEEIRYSFAEFHRSSLTLLLGLAQE